jgi:hypothetical protein
VISVAWYNVSSHQCYLERHASNKLRRMGRRTPFITT